MEHKIFENLRKNWQDILGFVQKSKGSLKWSILKRFRGLGAILRVPSPNRWSQIIPALTLIYLPQDWRCLISTSNSFNSAWMTAPKVKVLLLDVLEFSYFISRKFNFQSTITLSTDFYWKIGRGAALIKCWNFKHN